MKYLKQFFLSCLLLLASVTSFAQATSSTITGFVTDSSAVISDAVVVAVHIPTNTTYYALTNQKGQYVLNNVMTGGPYLVKVEKLGYETITMQDVMAPLAVAIQVDFAMQRTSVTLQTVHIKTQKENSLMNIQRSGVGVQLESRQLEMTPTVSRSLNDVMRFTPQSISTPDGFSAGGGNFRGSYATVDGASFNNAFGIGSNLPAGGSPISLDAIEQIRVDLTPYNVRQSGFIGSSINMVTKRGTNQWKGSVYDYFTSSELCGQKVEGNRLTSSSMLNNVSGFTVGGAIVKNKLFVFLNGEYTVDNAAGSTVQARPDENQEYGGSTGYNRPTTQQMDNILQFLSDHFDYNPGRYQNYSQKTPDYKLLGRIDWNINQNNFLNLRVSHTHTANFNTAVPSMTPLATGGFLTFVSNGETYQVNPYSQGRSSQYAMPFESANYMQNMDFTSISAEWNSRVLEGKGNNLLRATWSHQYNPRSYVGGDFPSVDILEPYLDENGVQQYSIYTTFGPDPFTFANLIEVHTITATDEFTYNTGIHNILAGAQFEWNRVRNGFMRGGAGWYIYDSWESFVNDVTDGSAEPVAFMITHANDDDPTKIATPSFDYMQTSVYAQDEMEFSRFFKLTAGLRLEIPVSRFVNDNYNENFAEVAEANPTSSFAGLSTDNLPKATVNVSPRVGFNWDMAHNGKYVLRGGTGIFTGRIPNVWLIGAAGNSNCLQYQYIANVASGLPVVHFNSDRSEIINSIYSGTTFQQQALAASTTATILATDLKMPSNWKSSLAFDMQLPGGIRATLEGIYSLRFHETAVTVLGYQEAGTIQLPGEPDQRIVYTSENITNADGATMSGYYLHNITGQYGHYGSVSLQLLKSFDFGLNLMAAYTYSNSWTISDGQHDQISSMSTEYALNSCNTPEHGYSCYVAPHRVLAAAAYTIKEGKRTATNLSLIYDGYNMGIYGGYYVSRYSYAMNNVNGLGNGQLVYIPTEAELAEMSFISEENKSAFNDFINSDSYLSKHRGQYSKRNAGVTPWLNRLDFKLSQEIYFKVNDRVQTLDLGVDVRNIGNLLCNKWGTYQILDSDIILNYNTETQQYTFSNPTWSSYNNIASTWQILCHIRYKF